jgi:hypothetical protein
VASFQNFDVVAVTFIAMMSAGVASGLSSTAPPPSSACSGIRSPLDFSPNGWG